MPVLGTRCVSALNVCGKKIKTFPRGKPLLENDSEAASIMKCLFHEGRVGDGVITGFPCLFNMIFRHLGC